jgi:hypothetical protein
MIDLHTRLSQIASGVILFTNLETKAEIRGAADVIARETLLLVSKELENKIQDLKPDEYGRVSKGLALAIVRGEVQ